MAVAQIMKDADRTIPHTYNGSENITGAAITWALLPLDATWKKDLDTLITDEALITKTLAAGQIVITDGAAGTFTVAILAADTGGLALGLYYVLVRILVGGVQLAPTAVSVELIAHE